MIPFALRQQYLANGFAVVPREVAWPAIAAPSPKVDLEALKAALMSACRARSSQFIKVPSIEQVVKSSTRVSDPTYDKLMKRLSEYQRKKKKYKELRQKYLAARRGARSIRETMMKGEGKQVKMSTASTADPSRLDKKSVDVWKLSQEILQQLQKERKPELCDSTVDNDPQLLSAISDHRVNLWMTSKVIEQAVRGEFGKCIGRIAEDVGGVERPVLFNDAPIYRDALGRPFCYHCNAPWIGIKHGATPDNASVCVYLCTDDVNECSLFAHVLMNSHMAVRSQLKMPHGCSEAHVDPNKLLLSFIPMESHMPFMTKHFSFGDEVVGRPLTMLRKGDVVVVNPFMMIGFGPNLLMDERVVWKLNVVSAESQPCLRLPSWVQSWRTSPQQVNFKAATVFPRLHAS